MPFRRSIARTILGIAALVAMPALVSAQIPEIRIVRQFSMGYLQFNVMEREGLIEKHAKALGLADAKVTWTIISGPSAVNDALLSGSVDIVEGVVPGMLTLWA